MAAARTLRELLPAATRGSCDRNVVTSAWTLYILTFCRWCWCYLCQQQAKAALRSKNTCCAWWNHPVSRCSCLSGSCYLRQRVAVEALRAKTAVFLDGIYLSTGAAVFLQVWLLTAISSRSFDSKNSCCAWNLPVNWCSCILAGGSGRR